MSSRERNRSSACAAGVSEAVGRWRIGQAKLQGNDRSIIATLQTERCTYAIKSASQLGLRGSSGATHETPEFQMPDVLEGHAAVGSKSG